MRSPHKPVPTADEFARAIIAAAGVYRVSPLDVCLSRAPDARRAAAAAVSALGLRGCAVGRVSWRLKVPEGTLRYARQHADTRFRAAEQAALEALQGGRRLAA